MLGLQIKKGVCGTYLEVFLCDLANLTLHIIFVVYVVRRDLDLAASALDNQIDHLSHGIWGVISISVEPC